MKVGCPVGEKAGSSTAVPVVGVTSALGTVVVSVDRSVENEAERVASCSGDKRGKVFKGADRVESEGVGSPGILAEEACGGAASA